MIVHRQHRYLLIALFFACCFLFVHKYNDLKRHMIADEHRIYASLLVELPRIERSLRLKQANLTNVQNRLNKVERYLTKYTWQLKRLIKTLDQNQQEQEQLLHFNPFDFDLEKNHGKFLVHFQFINVSNNIDYEVLNEFHSTISQINSPYVTNNKSEANLHIIYLPLRFYQRNDCYKDLIDKTYYVLYEFLDDVNDTIDERCFHGHFLPVKFFTRYDTNNAVISDDRWRLRSDNSQLIGLIYLSTNRSMFVREYDRLSREYVIAIECSHRPCYETVLNKNISIVALMCPSEYSISVQFRFYDVFFHSLSRRIHIVNVNCNDYLPYANVIDWLHPSTSFSWLYAVYFQTFRHRFHTLLAYLRTDFRLPASSNQLSFVEVQNQLVKHKTFYYLIRPRNLNFTAMPIGLMHGINFQSNKGSSIEIEPTFYDQWNRLYQPFYRSNTLSSPFDMTTSQAQYTILVLTHTKRFYQLTRLLSNLNGLINLHRVVVLFNQVDPIETHKNESLFLKDFLGDYEIYLPSIHVEIVYIFNLTNDLNNRFLPWHEFISTDCILSLDDDSFLRHDEIEHAFRVWKENRQRIVGFISRTHKSSTLEYDMSPSSCSYSMVLTGAAFLHRWYLDFYTNVMPRQIRQYVASILNCEDIGMNFLISYLTKQPPIKIGHRQSFHCYKCQESLSSKLNHYKQRTECIRYFSNVYRSMPLRHSVYYVDNLSNVTSCVS